MKKNSVQFVARTGLLLALCVVIQLVVNGQWVKGPLVNVVLLVAAFGVGLPCGLLVAVLNPLLVFLIAPPPVMLACPAILPVVMAGNCVLVAVAYLLRKPVQGVVGLAAAALAKGAVMTLLTMQVVLPFFGGALKPPQVAAVQATFGMTQAATAAVGCVVFWLVWKLLKKVLPAR